MQKLLAAASQAQFAATDMIDAVRDGSISPHGNIGSGDTLTIMVDGLRLLIEAMEDRPEHEEFDEDAEQLYGALVRFLQSGS